MGLLVTDWVWLQDAVTPGNTSYVEGPYADRLREYQERWLLSDVRYRTEPQGDAVEESEKLFGEFGHLLRGGAPARK